jgi:hypothetical protein
MPINPDKMYAAIWRDREGNLFTIKDAQSLGPTPEAAIEGGQQLQTETLCGIAAALVGLDFDPTHVMHVTAPDGAMHSFEGPMVGPTGTMIVGGPIFEKGENADPGFEVIEIPA